MVDDREEIWKFNPLHGLNAFHEIFGPVETGDKLERIIEVVCKHFPDEDYIRDTWWNTEQILEAQRSGFREATLVLFFALPLLSMLLISFRQGNIDGPLTIQNYQQFITSQTYLTVVWRSLLISVKVTAVVTVVGYTLAYSIVRFR